MNRLPLYNRLQQHNRSDRSSFHTPGHKCSDFFGSELLKHDYTELPDTDALYEADGVIMQTEELLSKLYHSERSLISAGGCTLAIQAMLRIASERGGKLLCARNVHRSAVNTMALLGMEPVWLWPEGQHQGFTGRILPDDVAKALNDNSGITACYITSPDYYGELCDIAAIADICHKKGVILLVDNAHGSHLAFMEQDMHPLHLGADMTACSLHKTMPVLTGGAVLNIGNKTLTATAKSAMSLFGSTSPSYMIMSSIDICTDYFLNGSGREDYSACEKRVRALRQLADRKGIHQPQAQCDPLRLTLDTASVGMYGKEMQEQYFTSHGIDCEFCDGRNAVMICTPFNTERDFQRLEDAIIAMPVKPSIPCQDAVLYKPKTVMSLREAMLSPTEDIAVSEIVGRIGADTACPCPPGVPVVMPGEMVTRAISEKLSAEGIKTFRVVKE